MEQRIGNVIIQAPGGTAAKGSNTYKVSLPSAWVKEMGITGDDRQIELCFDGNSIRITKRQDLQAFLESKRSRGDSVLLLNYFDKDTLCTQIAADFSDRTICVQNHISNCLRTAFGNNESPTWNDFEEFLEERCIPRSRAGLREYLEALGLEEYDPLEIIKKTSGKMAEDSQWIQIEVVE